MSALIVFPNGDINERQDQEKNIDVVDVQSLIAVLKEPQGNDNADHARLQNMTTHQVKSNGHQNQEHLQKDHELTGTGTIG